MQGYLQNIWAQFDWQGLLAALQRVLGVLLCLSVHETCQVWRPTPWGIPLPSGCAV